MQRLIGMPIRGMHRLCDIVASARRATRACVALSMACIALAAQGRITAAAAPNAALVIDANTGATLYEREADKPRYPASLTKMMTLYLLFEALEQKRLGWESRIVLSERAAAKPPSSLELPAGASISVKEAVLALIVKSANDVACAVGETLAGSEEKFARAMTAKARQLGMPGTSFRNASGLPDNAQVTTARDMVTLAMRLAHDFPEPYKLFSSRHFTHKGESHRNHNTLLFNFEGTDGIKTGYIRASGFNLVASVRRGKRHVIGVVMGGSTAGQRNAQMRAILTAGLGKAQAMDKPMLVRRPVLIAEPRVPGGAAGQAQVARGAEPRLAVAAAAPARSTEEPAVGRRRPSVRIAAPVEQPPDEVSRSPAAAVDTTAPARPERVATPAIAAPAPAKPFQAQLATPPGTLQQQAMQQETAQAAAISPPARTVSEKPAALGGRAAPPAPVAATAVTAPPSVAGTHHVQIGAYTSAVEAQRRLTDVSGRAGVALSQFAPLTMAFNKAGTQYWRARYSGFDEAQANATCQSLKQQQIDCIVVRAQ
jgi:D-alanyl-D-alanine carboxypeptidase